MGGLFSVEEIRDKPPKYNIDSLHSNLSGYIKHLKKFTEGLQNDIRMSIRGESGNKHLCVCAWTCDVCVSPTKFRAVESPRDRGIRH